MKKALALGATVLLAGGIFMAAPTAWAATPGVISHFTATGWDDDDALANAREEMVEIAKKSNQSCRELSHELYTEGFWGQSFADIRAECFPLSQQP